MVDFVKRLHWVRNRRSYAAFVVGGGEPWEGAYFWHRDSAVDYSFYLWGCHA